MPLSGGTHPPALHERRVGYVQAIVHLRIGLYNKEVYSMNRWTTIPWYKRGGTTRTGSAQVARQRLHYDLRQRPTGANTRHTDRLATDGDERQAELLQALLAQGGRLS
jgi:hypothetical protein